MTLAAPRVAALRVAARQIVTQRERCGTLRHITVRYVAAYCSYDMLRCVIRSTHTHTHTHTADRVLYLSHQVYNVYRQTGRPGELYSLYRSQHRHLLLQSHRFFTACAFAVQTRDDITLQCRLLAIVQLLHISWSSAGGTKPWKVAQRVCRFSARRAITFATLSISSTVYDPRFGKLY